MPRGVCGAADEGGLYGDARPAAEAAQIYEIGGGHHRGRVRPENLQLPRPHLGTRRRGQDRRGLSGAGCAQYLEYERAELFREVVGGGAVAQRGVQCRV